LTSFHKHKPASDGRKSRCKDCRRAYSRRYRREHREECKERDRQYYQENAEAIKEWNRRYREQNKEAIARRDARYRAANKGKLRAYFRDHYRRNREAKIAYSKQWAEEHREHRREYLAQYRAENAESLSEYFKAYGVENAEKRHIWVANYRARKMEAEGSYSFDEWEQLCALFDEGCASCQRKDEPLEADHIVPLTWEATSNWIDNIQPLCKSCNSSKGNHHDTDYRPAHVKAWAENKMDIQFFEAVTATMMPPEEV